MEEISNGRMAHLLSIDTHRKEYPVVRWIEENIQKGKVTVGGKDCLSVIQEVSVRFVEQFEYEVIDGKVTKLISGWISEAYFEDPARPTRKEVDLLEVCDYTCYKILKRMCQEILTAFRHPHSCTIDYHVMERQCVGCDREGPVNYLGGTWQYYCGGSPRCCP